MSSENTKMTLNLDTLENLILNATPGPWKSDQCGDVWTIAIVDTDTEECKAAGMYLFRMIGTTPTAPNNPDAAYIASFNPQVTLELIRQHRVMHEFITGLANIHKQGFNWDEVGHSWWVLANDCLKTSGWRWRN